MFKFGQKKKNPTREVDSEPEPEPEPELIAEPELEADQKEKISKRAKLGGYL